VPGWLGVYHLRWHDVAGGPLEDEVIAFRAATDGQVRRVEPEEFGILLREPLAVGSLLAPTPGVAVADRLRIAAEREIGSLAGRYRHPGSLFLLAAASFVPGAPDRHLTATERMPERTVMG
jgi:hypothetical protein